MRMLTTGRVVLLGLLLIASTAACGGDKAKDERDKAQQSLATREGGVTSATSAAAGTATVAGTAPAGAAGSGGTAGGIAVTLTEMKVTPSAAKAAPGSVTFAARNTGVIPHELVVAKTDTAPDKLEVRNGAVDESKVQKVGDTNEFPGGESKTLTANLTPGKYVLFCNVIGHYQAGMQAAFTVE